MANDKETSLANIIVSYVDAMQLIKDVSIKKEISEEERARADMLLTQFKLEFGEELLTA